MNKVIFLIGPMGSGKGKLGDELKVELNAEVFPLSMYPRLMTDFFSGDVRGLDSLARIHSELALVTDFEPLVETSMYADDPNRIGRKDMNRTTDITKFIRPTINAEYAIQEARRSGAENFIFDGARDPREVALILKEFPDALAIYIDAEYETRKARILGRGKLGDPTDPNELDKVLQRDLEWVEPCKSVDGVVVLKNDGDWATFRKEVDKELKKKGYIEGNRQSEEGQINLNEESEQQKGGPKESY